MSLWFLLLRFLEVILTLTTTAFILLSGPSYLETSGSSIWISNTCTWKHSELYRMLSQVRDVVGTDAKIWNKMIWGLLRSVSLDLNWRSFHKYTLWYSLSQSLDQITFLPLQYLELPGIIMLLFLTLSRKSLIHTFHASIKRERNSLHSWIQCYLAPGLFLRARERWLWWCLSCSHTSHCCQSLMFFLSESFIAWIKILFSLEIQCEIHKLHIYFFLKINLFIYGCVGSSFLCEGFL